MEPFIIDEIKITQEADTNSDPDEIQSITIEFLDNGSGEFYCMIKEIDPKWTFDVDELPKIKEELNRIIEHNRGNSKLMFDKYQKRERPEDPYP